MHDVVLSPTADNEQLPATHSAYMSTPGGFSVLERPHFGGGFC